MKSGKLNKMATTLAVLFLVMSGLMVAQWNAQPVEATEHEDYNYTIEGFIEPKGNGTIQSDLDIKLRDLSTGDTRTEKTSQYFYEFTDVNPGWYEIIFPSQVDMEVEDGIAYMENTTEPFKVSEDTIVEAIEIDNEWIEGNTVTGNITANGELVEDSTVILEDKERGFYHSTSADAKMTENNKSYEIEIYEGFNGLLKVEKEGFAPHVNTSFELPDDDYNVTLSTRPYLEGTLVDEEGRGIKEELDITLYNDEIGILHEKMTGPTFRIRGPADEYLLVVDAPGYEPLIREEVTLYEDESKRLSRENTSVGESGEETFDSEIDFGDDIETIEVETTRTMRASTKMKTLDYSHIGNLAMQIDMTLGNGNQSLNEDDVDDFKKRLNYTQDIPSTQRFITVDDTVYELDTYTTDPNGFDKLEGNVTELFTGEIEFTSERTYEAVDIDEDEKHTIDLTVENDHFYGNKRDFNYTLTLLGGYERFDGGDQEIPGDVDVEGYTTIEIDPQGDERTSTLTLDVRESEAGEVDILVDPDRDVEPSIYEKEDGNWVIRKGTEVTFEADYMPKTSQALNYTWTLGDDPSGYQTEFNTTFNEVKQEELKVEVEESRGPPPIEDAITITVDDEGPWGENITVNDKNITLEQNTSVNETEEVEFNASNFQDNETEVVDRYQWNFSDGSEIQEGENVKHIFNVPGEYEVILNVTDVVGNSNEEYINVTVMDITEPEGNFSIEWNGNVTYEPTVRVEEETNVTFNGTEIIAHPEEYEESELDFNWTLIYEDETLEENVADKNWTYRDFTEPGEYTIRLNVTDEPSELSEGNYRVIEKTIIIERGPVPDLMVHDLRFSDGDVREGDTVTISVNVTNLGEMNATSIETSLNREPLDIEEVKFYQNGEELETDEIGQGETVKVQFEWEAEEDGENTVTVNITDENEPDDLRFDNEAEDTINVDPPAWREYLVYALIPIIIIGVAVGLYLFRDRLGEILR